MINCPAMTGPSIPEALMAIKLLAFAFSNDSLSTKSAITDRYEGNFNASRAAITIEKIIRKVIDIESKEINSAIKKKTIDTDAYPSNNIFSLLNLSANTPPKVQKIIKIRPVNPATVPTQKGESVKSNASQP